MMINKRQSGFAIALAWPETFCKQPGSWYDGLTARLGPNRYNYYKAGHAAVVLTDIENRENHYFDFGRYHAPFQYGRARSGETDHDLKMKTIPEISADGKSLLNYDEILEELQSNAACHGEGKLHAAYAHVDFQKAYHSAIKIQQQSPVPYGPFVINGSNCSRFVNTVIRAGKPKFKHQFRLKYFVPFTPTPMNNVNSLLHKRVIPVIRETKPFKPFRWLSNEAKQTTLPPPERHASIPAIAQWLSGEGAGSWFVPEIRQGFFLVTRYASDGTKECSGIYRGLGNAVPELSNSLFESGALLFDHLSTCSQITLRNRSGERFRFVRAYQYRQRFASATSESITGTSTSTPTTVTMAAGD